MTQVGEAIARYHKLIESGPYIDLGWAQALQEQLKAAKLGGRAISPVLRPHFLSGRDYAAMAKACGYPRAFNFSALEDFERALPEILGAAGPVFVALKVLPEVENSPIGQRVRWRKRSSDKVVSDARAALEVG